MITGKVSISCSNLVVAAIDLPESDPQENGLSLALSAIRIQDVLLDWNQLQTGPTAFVIFLFPLYSPP